MFYAPDIVRLKKMKTYWLYEINFPNSKKYIGITCDLKRRLASYKTHSRNGSTKQKVFNAIRKYGIEDLKLEPLVIGEESYIRDLEKKTIALYRTREIEFGYNQAIGGEMSPVAGIGHSVASKLKMSVSQKKRIHTPKEVAKMAASLKGRVMSSEHRRKLSEAAIKRSEEGRGLSTESKRAISKAHRTGKISLPNQKMRASTLSILVKVKELMIKELSGIEIASILNISGQYACRLMSRCQEPILLD